MNKSKSKVSSRRISRLKKIYLLNGMCIFKRKSLVILYKDVGLIIEWCIFKLKK